MPASAQRSLVKPFEPSSCAAARVGPKAAMPAAARSSTIPATSGASGPTTTKPMPVAPAEADDGSVVGDVEGDELGDLGDAGIARRGVELGQPRRLGQLPGQRVLAPAGADEEDLHGTCAAVTPTRARLAIAVPKVRPAAFAPRAGFALEP